VEAAAVRCYYAMEAMAVVVVVLADRVALSMRFLL
jgi:hypothetical protein